MNCTVCGFRNLVESRFCSGCGVSLASKQRPSEQAERRQITAIFCDIVGYTPLSQNLDPEELQEMIACYHTTCSRVVREHGGHIAQYLGDGILIFFGYPLSQEGDVRRAVQCGLNLLEALKSEGLHSRSHADQKATPIQARIGIHTGRVVIASSAQTWNQENLAYGDVTTIAARIQAHANPNSVFVSDETWKIIGGYFVGIPRQNVSLKGLEQPRRLWDVLDMSSSTTRLDASDSLTAFVGRREELLLLEQRWHDALSCKPNSLLIQGEAGIGKSRLAQSFLEDLKQSVYRIKLIFSEDTKNSSFLPLINLLKDQFQLKDGDRDQDTLHRLEAGLARLGLRLEEAVPLIATILGIPWESDYPPLTLSPARKRSRTIEILAATLEAFTSQAPTILLVEDLHWADPSSLDVFCALLDAMPSIPLLVLFTARPQFQPPSAFRAAAGLLRVLPLQGHEVAAMARSVAHGKAVPGELIRQIIRHSDGVPLFIEEVVRSVIDSGVLKENDHTWTLNCPIPDTFIPASIDALLSARIDQLRDARATAQLAATIGREFSLSLLSAVSQRSEESLRLDLQKMLQAGLASEQSEVTHDKYVFRHALIQRAAYESILLKQRRIHHAKIADVLLQDFNDKNHTNRQQEGQHEVIAHHLSCAGRQVEAADYWLQAGLRSLNRVAVPEAHGHLSRGLEGLRQVSPSQAVFERELDLQIAIAPTLMTLQGWGAPSVASSCLRAQDLCKQLQCHDKLYSPIWGLWSNRFVAGQLDDALATATQALEMATAAGSPLLEVTGRHAMAYSHYYRGEWLAAIEHAQAGLALFSLEQEKELTTTFQISSSVNLHATLGSCHWMLGRQEVGLDYLDSMIALARSIGHPSALSNALGVACYMHTFHHDFPRTARFAEELCSFAREDGWELWYAVGVLFGGWAQLRMGASEQGLQRMFEGLELFAATHSGLMITTIAIVHADALVASGRSVEAATVLAEAAEQARQGQIGVLLPEVHRLRGRILERLGDQDGARDAVQRALQIAREQGATSLELRAALEWCRLEAHPQANSEARKRLQRCYKKFKEGFHHRDLQTAARILADKPTGAAAVRR
jgi:class 3 adenylate cyclase/tetratricopeptide (TPR) repeat protein